jgi:hypothetical protein
MAATDGRTPAEVRRDIESEREELARAVESLRAGLGEATDVTRKLQGKLPLAAAAAAGAGFLLAGGIGATMRLLARRGREGRRKAKVGRYTIVED